MIIEENIECWEDFEPKLEEIKRKFGQTSVDILYRGQSASCRHLETTLERYGKVGITLEDYLDCTLRCVNQIESFTKNKFNLSKKNIINEINKNPNSFGLNLPCYEYWIYLRHHGFPSPLLDWTSCPFIAAFFAFASQNKAERCSIYVYNQEGMKEFSSQYSRIWLLGHYINADVRHSLQQSWYTIALKADPKQVRPDKTEIHKHRIRCHEEIFKSLEKEQDLIIKINIPNKERSKVLKYLDEKDINHFSLFQSEESLMKTLAFKELQSCNLDV